MDGEVKVPELHQDGIHQIKHQMIQHTTHLVQILQLVKDISTQMLKVLLQNKKLASQRKLKKKHQRPKPQKHFIRRDIITIIITRLKISEIKELMKLFTDLLTMINQYFHSHGEE